MNIYIITGRSTKTGAKRGREVLAVVPESDAATLPETLEMLRFAEWDSLRVESCDTARPFHVYPERIENIDGGPHYRAGYRDRRNKRESAEQLVYLTAGADAAADYCAGFYYADETASKKEK